KYTVAVNQNLVLVTGPCRKARVKWLSSKTQIYVHPNLELGGSTLDIKSTVTQKTLKVLIGGLCFSVILFLLSFLLGNPLSANELISVPVALYIMTTSYFHYEMMTLPEVLSAHLTE
ncbi:MAG: hypothetical protein AAF635_11630, partial [Cyanobacteria bacterium P01_C01_bin.69]